MLRLTPQHTHIRYDQGQPAAEGHPHGSVGCFQLASLLKAWCLAQLLNISVKSLTLNIILSFQMDCQVLNDRDLAFSLNGIKNRKYKLSVLVNEVDTAWAQYIFVVKL